MIPSQNLMFAIALFCLAARCFYLEQCSKYSWNQMAIMLEERDSLMHSIPCCNVPGIIHILYESSHSQVF